MGVGTLGIIILNSIEARRQCDKRRKINQGQKERIPSKHLCSRKNGIDHIVSSYADRIP
jgi:hypothetical protein